VPFADGGQSEVEWWGCIRSVREQEHERPVDKTDLTERTGKLSRLKLDLVLSGIDVVLGR
jgi:hypothetical protein